MSDSHDTDRVVPGPDAAYAELVDVLLDEPEVSTGKMFASQGVRLNAKYFALLNRGRLVVKLPAPRVTELVGSGVGEQFEPGEGRKMREWIVVPVGHHDRWHPLAREALAYAHHLAGG